MKIWQGTALGCPEPIISEVIKNHESILPYHGHFSSPDISSYPGHFSPGDLSSYPGLLNGGSYGGVYADSPAPPAPTYSGPTYLPPNQPSNSYLPPSNSYGSPSAPGGSSDSYPTGGGDQSGGYPNRRKSREVPSGRQISEESQTIFSDLIFRFLGVKSDQCRRRFICELEYRNPFMGYAMKYIG